MGQLLDTCCCGTQLAVAADSPFFKAALSASGSAYLNDKDLTCMRNPAKFMLNKRALSMREKKNESSNSSNPLRKSNTQRERKLKSPQLIESTAPVKAAETQPVQKRPKKQQLQQESIPLDQSAAESPQSDVRMSYNIGRELGTGKYGTVRLASKKSYEHKRFALKTISRTLMMSKLGVMGNNEELENPLLENEFEILKQVDHPNIIKFYEMYVDDKDYHLVTEYCGGGELFDHIIERGKFSESYASRIIKQILSAIKHLHDRNICHRDLKPENILFESKSKDAQVKLIDFGLSKYFISNNYASRGSLIGRKEQNLMQTKIGTPYYMAPEVIKGSYDQTCDMWSLGVIAYCLLCGYPPFNAENDLQLFRKISKCEYEFYMPEWGSVSQDAKDFIDALLQLDPKKRLTPEQALSHPWITMEATTQQPKLSQASKQVLTRLAMFQKPNLFQKEILLLLGALLNSKQLKEIRDTFSAIDADSSGTITLAELSAAYQQAGGEAPPNLKEIIKRVDFDENGEINYSEFVSSTLDRTLLNRENLLKVYRFLQQDENEQGLTYHTLRAAFQRKGDFDQKLFDKMMIEIALSPQVNEDLQQAPLELPFLKKQAQSLGPQHRFDNLSQRVAQSERNYRVDFTRFCEIMGVLDTEAGFIERQINSAINLQSASMSPKQIMKKCRNKQVLQL
ncbi:hypothetical protein FGO68_gene11276 [Halteria grandinella]|uniref:Calmodulin n=1 Tax=Halteria grandinella TaxID=5974 RepID=A0A8J8NZM9_HALGN|nr:hypothetical protein FGO68_gene11276 [Halteria grandinella]